MKTNQESQIKIKVDGTEPKNSAPITFVIRETMWELPTFVLLMNDENIFNYYEKKIEVSYSSELLNFTFKGVSTTTKLVKDGVLIHGINSTPENHKQIHTDILGTTSTSILQKVGDKRQLDGIMNFQLTYPCIRETYNRILIKMLTCCQSDDKPLCITIDKIRKFGTGKEKEIVYTTTGIERLQIPKIEKVKLQEENKKFFSSFNKSGFITYSENRTYLENLDTYVNYKNQWRYLYTINIDNLDINYYLGDKVKFDDKFMDTKTHYVIEKIWTISPVKLFTKLVVGGY